MSNSRDLRFPNNTAVQIYSSGFEIARYEPADQQWHLRLAGKSVPMQEVLAALAALQARLDDMGREGT